MHALFLRLCLTTKHINLIPVTSVRNDTNFQAWVAKSEANSSQTFKRVIFTKGTISDAYISSCFCKKTGYETSTECRELERSLL